MKINAPVMSHMKTVTTIVSGLVVTCAYVAEPAAQSTRATLVTLRTPDGFGIELDKFHTPAPVRYGPVNAPMNALGMYRVMLAVDDIDAMVARTRAHGSGIIGEMQYEDAYRLAYIRGPEGAVVALAEQLG